MRNTIKAIPLVALLVLLLCAAKSTIGQNFTEANLPQLQIGVSTLPDAVGLLGAQPQSSQAGASGATAYSWQFIEAKGSMWTGKVQSASKRVVLVFNTDGTFQRILQMDGITLDPATHKRLFTDPAAAYAAKIAAGG